MSDQTNQTEQSEIEVNFLIRDPRKFFMYAAVISVGYVILRHLWLNDDSFIALRVADNFINGYGLRWNVVERVQVFTNPLWTLLVTVFYWILKEPYNTLYTASFVVSLAAVWLLFSRFTTPHKVTILGALILVNSRAFIDYSSSGLENPLTHLLLILFLAVFLLGDQQDPKRYLKLTLLASLMAFNRLDTILLPLPALIYEGYQQRANVGRLVGQTLLGLTPILLWEAFSILYYGFPFPNTYYAKVGTGIPQAELTDMGQKYLENSLHWDPITLISFTFAWTLAIYNKNKNHLIALAGGLLYIGYVVRIGGDFMSGRFFSAVFVIGMVVILSSELEKIFSMAEWPKFLWAAFMIVSIGMSANHPILLHEREDQNLEFDAYGGIADEKLWYFNQTGWVIYNDTHVPHNWTKEGQAAYDVGDTPIERAAIGFFGYEVGQDIYILDTFVLSDPLRARLPLTSQQRVGHYARIVPLGYFETIEADFEENLIENPSLKEYYDHLLVLTQSEQLFSAERLKLIWQFNTGQFDDLIDAYMKTKEWVPAP